MTKVRPGAQGGVTKLHVGCGPKNMLDDWWNVDVIPFRGLDQQLDVTKNWGMKDCLHFIYAEHFLEHLPLRSAFVFLANARESLIANGKIRLSTPSLEWVLATHFPSGQDDQSAIIKGTFSINRAFYGWGHSFLYSKPMLTNILQAAGFANILFQDYGVSSSPELCGLERHGGFSRRYGLPSVWIVEAQATDKDIQVEGGFMALAHEEFIKYVDGGH
jgi:predicted SAM-dependent methyltransferase